MPKYKCVVGFKGSPNIKMKVAFAEWGFSKFKRLIEDQIFPKNTERKINLRWSSANERKSFNKMR